MLSDHSIPRKRFATWSWPRSATATVRSPRSCGRLALTPAQAEVVLTVLARSARPLTVRAVGDRLVCEPGSPSRLVASLAAAGLIDRTVDPRHARLDTRTERPRTAGGRGRRPCRSGFPRPPPRGPPITARHRGRTARPARNRQRRRVGRRTKASARRRIGARPPSALPRVIALPPPGHGTSMRRRGECAPFRYFLTIGASDEQHPCLPATPRGPTRAAGRAARAAGRARSGWLAGRGGTCSTAAGVSAPGVFNRRRAAPAVSSAGVSVPDFPVSSPDFGHPEPMVAAARRELEAVGVRELPEGVLADLGYWHSEQLQQLEADDIPVLIPPDRDRAQRHGQSAVRPTPQRQRASRRRHAGRAMPRRASPKRDRAARCRAGRGWRAPRTRPRRHVRRQCPGRCRRSR